MKNAFKFLRCRVCNYRFNDGTTCPEPPVKDSDYCILHVDIPAEEGETRSELIQAKEKKVKEMLDSGNYDFRGAILPEFDISNRTIKGKIILNDSKIIGDVFIINASVKGDISLDRSEVGGLTIDNTSIHGNVSLRGATNLAYVRVGKLELGRVTIEGDLDLSNSEVMNVQIINTYVRGRIFFESSQISGYVYISETEIQGYVSFGNSRIVEDVTFKEVSTYGLSFLYSEIRLPLCLLMSPLRMTFGSLKQR